MEHIQKLIALLVVGVLSSGVAAATPGWQAADADRSFFVERVGDEVRAQTTQTAATEDLLQLFGEKCPDYQEACRQCRDLCAQFCQGCLNRAFVCGVGDGPGIDGCGCGCMCETCSLTSERILDLARVA